jgi:eukaryotic-like serine/threonine-protein kinase
MVPERTPKPDAPEQPALKKYRLVGQLAKGGMAELFLARAAGIGGFERLLVIKRILPELSRDPEVVRMLLDEARTAATLQHANIVQVFDVDMVDGNVFFAMEYLQGQHVLALLERARSGGARIPLENAIAIAIAVAAGLHYAHERWGTDGKPLGIVHRDVAPNNVIVTYDGGVKLIDFGIAKSANNLSSTRFGLFKGKLPYASPEQCRCEPVDRRTDVFSLGVLLYELTTGFPAFAAESEFELLRLMTEAMVPRPRLRDKAYPRELEKIVLKALARDPAERYQTAQQLQLDLEVFAAKAGHDVSAFSLSRLMSSLFSGELDNWRVARGKGLTLEQHIVRTAPGWESEERDSIWTLPEDEDAETIRQAEPVPEPSTVRPRPPAWRRHVRLALALVGIAVVAGWIIAGPLPGPQRVAPVPPPPPHPQVSTPPVVAPPPAPPTVPIPPPEPPTSAPEPAPRPPRKRAAPVETKKRVVKRPTVESAPDDLDSMVPR